MGNFVDVKEVQTLSDLAKAFHRFGTETSETLDRIESQLRALLDQFQRKLTYDQRELERCVENVHDARMALNDCESMEEEDYSPDCTHEHDALESARHDREAAEQSLRETQKWRSRVDRQIQDYRNMAGRVKKMADLQIGQAKVMLQKKLFELERYMNVTSEVVTALGVSGGIYGTADSTHNVTGVSVLAKHASESDSVNCAGGSFSWMELGIKQIELRKLPDIEGITDEHDFKKVPMSDMQAGLKRYLEIKESVEAGREKDKEYWAKVDRERGLSYRDGYQRVFEAFYGMEPIRITKDGENYTIENGRHRIWLARQMGILELPVSIVERKGAES